MKRFPAFSVLFLLLVSACNQRELKNYSSRKNQSNASRETAETVTIEYTDSGDLKARISAPYMVAVKQVKNPFVEMTKGVKVDFFKSDGSIESYLTAEYAISYTEKKRIIVKRNVEVLNVKGDTMNTEELVWDQKTQRITSDKYVTIRTKSQTINGFGMESDQTFSNWEIRNVIGTINKAGSKND